MRKARAEVLGLLCPTALKVHLTSRQVIHTAHASQASHGPCGDMTSATFCITVLQNPLFHPDCVSIVFLRRLAPEAPRSAHQCHPREGPEQDARQASEAARWWTVAPAVICCCSLSLLYRQSTSCTVELESMACPAGTRSQVLLRGRYGTNLTLLPEPRPLRARSAPAATQSARGPVGILHGCRDRCHFSVFSP